MRLSVAARNRHDTNDNSAAGQMDTGEAEKNPEVERLEAAESAITSYSAILPASMSKVSACSSRPPGASQVPARRGLR